MKAATTGKELTAFISYQIDRIEMTIFLLSKLFPFIPILVHDNAVSFFGQKFVNQISLHLVVWSKDL